jgi:hypothetical protein
MRRAPPFGARPVRAALILIVSGLAGYAWKRAAAIGTAVESVTLRARRGRGDCLVDAPDDPEDPGDALREVDALSVATS